MALAKPDKLQSNDLDGTNFEQFLTLKAEKSLINV